MLTFQVLTLVLLSLFVTLDPRGLATCTVVYRKSLAMRLDQRSQQPIGQDRGGVGATPAPTARSKSGDKAGLSLYTISILDFSWAVAAAVLPAVGAIWLAGSAKQPRCDVDGIDVGLYIATPPPNPPPLPRPPGASCPRYISRELVARQIPCLNKPLVSV